MVIWLIVLETRKSRTRVADLLKHPCRVGEAL
jgi:hypothetical protein